MAKFRHVEWDLPEGPSGHIAHWEALNVAVLMDIRDELKKLNALLHCQNFTAIPHTLKTIARNTTKPKPKKGTPRNAG